MKLRSKRKETTSCLYNLLKVWNNKRLLLRFNSRRSKNGRKRSLRWRLCLKNLKNKVKSNYKSRIKRIKAWRRTLNKKYKNWTKRESKASSSCKIILFKRISWLSSWSKRFRGCKMRKKLWFNSSLLNMNHRLNRSKLIYSCKLMSWVLR